jgi:CRISPR/Cas system-associated endonuclease Cas1
MMAAVPIADISHIALHGPITMTGAAVARVLDAGLDVTLHTSTGRLRGMLTSAQPKNVATAELARHLVRAGFDTRIGLFHGLRYGRESLPLDLVDEVRAPMVDRFTTNLLHRRQLGADDFEQGDDFAVRLSNDARRRYLELWEEMLSTHAAQLRGEAVPSDGEEPNLLVERDNQEAESSVTWRRRMQRQVARLYQFLMRGTPYRGLLAAPDPTPRP